MGALCASLHGIYKELNVSQRKQAKAIASKAMQALADGHSAEARRLLQSSESLELFQKTGLEEQMFTLELQGAG